MPVHRHYDLTVVLNYYLPYVSGLTETAREIAEGLAARGHRVAVVACRHDRSLPRRERHGGVDIYRSPVIGRISRGPVSPAFGALVARLARNSRTVHLHTPMLEAGLLARLCPGTRLVTTHHADLLPGSGLLGSTAVRALDASAAAAMRRSSAVVVNSLEQARHSRLWPHLRELPLVPIAAPCRDRSGGRPRYREGPGLHIGYAGRIHPEKGLEYLVRAFRLRAAPHDRLLLAGDYLTVAGGSNVDALRKEIAGDPRVALLGLLDHRRMCDFYASIDVFALPSITESFGIAQTEAMMCGIPAVTSDVPGGRVPVTATGFGRLVPPRDPAAIAEAIAEVGRPTPRQRTAGAARARALFGLDGCLDAYEKTLVRPEETPGPAAAATSAATPQCRPWCHNTPSTRSNR
ncbi:glycosyltransferase family 4 protein [Streptomyces monticola]|uniref:Glycosyltransferase family 4 protein n=1 Tax=Streptomyces monticola TaxID=2666263 RepID=A0ABW2JQF8_9ACTN